MQQSRNTKFSVELWSDSCGGQNRNITMVAFLLRMVFDDKLFVNKITHHIHESGHSFLPNDQDLFD